MTSKSFGRNYFIVLLGIIIFLPAIIPAQSTWNGFNYPRALPFSVYPTIRSSSASYDVIQLANKYSEDLLICNHEGIFIFNPIIDEPSMIEPFYSIEGSDLRIIFAARAEDLNIDGFDDIIIFAENEMDEIGYQLFIQDRFGEFTDSGFRINDFATMNNPINSITNYSSRQLYFADVNRDNILDIFFQSFTNPSFVYYMTSDGSLNYQTNKSSGNYVQAEKQEKGFFFTPRYNLHDLDGNRIPEIMINNVPYEIADSEIVEIELAGVDDLGFRNRHYRFKDFNDDGLPELYLGRANGSYPYRGYATMYENKGNYTFEETTIFNYATGNFSSQAVGGNSVSYGSIVFIPDDFNLDGNQDLLYNVFHKYIILFGNSEGTFSSSISIPIDNTEVPDPPVFADFSGNGEKTMFVIPEGQFNDNDRYYYFSSNTFDNEHYKYRKNLYPTDILKTKFNSETQEYDYYGNRGNEYVLINRILSEYNVIDFPEESKLIVLDLIDVNSDGLIDIKFALFDGFFKKNIEFVDYNALYYLLQPDGTFIKGPLPQEAYYAAGYLEFADLTGDGKKEFLSNYEVTHSFEVFSQDENDEFVYETRINNYLSSPTIPLSLRETDLLDVNNDTLADFIQIGSGSSDVENEFRITGYTIINKSNFQFDEPKPFFEITYTAENSKELIDYEIGNIDNNPLTDFIGYIYQSNDLPSIFAVLNFGSEEAEFLELPLTDYASTFRANKIQSVQIDLDDEEEIVMLMLNQNVTSPFLATIELVDGELDYTSTSLEIETDDIRILKNTHGEKARLITYKDSILTQYEILSKTDFRLIKQIYSTKGFSTSSYNVIDINNDGWDDLFGDMSSLDTFQIIYDTPQGLEGDPIQIISKEDYEAIYGDENETLSDTTIGDLNNDGIVDRVTLHEVELVTDSENFETIFYNQKDLRTEQLTFAARQLRDLDQDGDLDYL